MRIDRPNLTPTPSNSNKLPSLSPDRSHLKDDRLSLERTKCQTDLKTIIVEIKRKMENARITNHRYFSKEAEVFGGTKSMKKPQLKLRAANISPLQIRESEMSKSSFNRRDYYEPKKKTVSLRKRKRETFDFEPWFTIDEGDFNQTQQFKF